MRKAATFVIGSMIAAVGLAAWLQMASAEDARVLPPAAADETAPPGSETAVLAGGCFWGMQGMFEHVKGVQHVWAGYSGGASYTAHYAMVGTETTGHAESIKIAFDPKVVSYGTLLRLYFSVAHDPTELNRQGPDEGSSYRSEIFFASPEQEKIAHAYIAQLTKAHVFAEPIVTKVEALNGFYPAEGYHQDYLIHHPESGYIQVNDLPKIANLKRLYPTLYRDTPVMVTER
ncbi:MAG TPA: peptide-methionine (S)-S-oxide reductase MsrA [Rhizomicrobium sp.]|jgi:peptide-methionine (S)-S-oxide reductase